MEGTTQAITEIIDNYVDIESQEKNRKTSQVSNFTLKDSIRQIVKLQKTTVLLIVIIILSATELLRLLIVQKWYNLHWRKLSSRRRNFIVQTKIFIPKIGLFYSIFEFVQNAKYGPSSNCTVEKSIMKPISDILAHMFVKFIIEL